MLTDQIPPPMLHALFDTSVFFTSTLINLASVRRVTNTIGVWQLSLVQHDQHDAARTLALKSAGLPVLQSYALFDPFHVTALDVDISSFDVTCLPMTIRRAGCKQPKRQTLLKTEEAIQVMEYFNQSLEAFSNDSYLKLLGRIQR